MGRQRKTYSEGFKRKVIIDALKSNGNYAEVGSKHDVAPSLVYTWVKDFESGRESREVNKLKKNLEELLEQNEVLTKELGKKQLEVELLKKKTSRH